MKKIIALVFVLFAFMSCKKDRLCECVIETGNGTIVVETTLYDVKKREARLNCIGSQTVTKTATSSMTSNKTTCKLK